LDVTVKYLALHRELVNKSEEKVQLNEESTIKELWNKLLLLHPNLEDVKDDTTISLNGMFADLRSRLRSGDVVTLFAVVDGG
jgi:molybdopterin converting factor small subunit